MILQAGYDGFHLVLRSGNENVCLVLGNEEFAEELARRWNLGEVKKTTPQIGQPRTGTITREEIRKEYELQGDWSGPYKERIKALEANNVPTYPKWICAECGSKFGHTIPDCATFHQGICGWCALETAVTEPRDYGYPTHPSEEAK